MCIASCKRFILSFVSHKYLFAVINALLSVQEQCQCSIVPDELVQICFIEMRQYDFNVDASIFVVKTMLSVDSRDHSSDPSKDIVHELLQIETTKIFPVAVGCALYWKQHVPSGCAASVPQVQRDGAEVAQDQSRGQIAC